MKLLKILDTYRKEKNHNQHYVEKAISDERDELICKPAMFAAELIVGISQHLISIAFALTFCCFGFAYGQTTMASDMFPGAPPIQYSSLTGPAFLTNKTSMVRAVAGATAVLPCDVKNLHNYTVSWVRGSDVRLLTAGVGTYTSDPRFIASHTSGGTQWLLKIHYVSLNDSDSYLCQVSTTPPITLTVNLTVYEAVARVLPGPEVHVKSGSRLEIMCEVEGCPAPALLSWSKGAQPLVTETSTLNDVSDYNDTSPFARIAFMLPLATNADSGTYSCTSSCTKAVNVTVHVLKGEELAAMQHHNSSEALGMASNTAFFVSIVILVTLWWGSQELSIPFSVVKEKTEPKLYSKNTRSSL